MFHDYKPPPSDPEVLEPWQQPPEEGEWQRIKRPIYSKFWRGVHNLIAHPLLAIHRPTGERLHDYTAERMYEPRPGVDPIVTDND